MCAILINEDLYSVCFNVAIHHSINGKTGNRLDAQFFSNVLAVGDNGGQADIKFVGYLFVDKSFGDKYQYFYFPDRQFMFRFSMCIALSAACFLA